MTGIIPIIYHLSSFFYSFTTVICHLPSVIRIYMNFLRFIPSFLRNKYLLTLSVFAVWMLFFDKNDVFTQLQRSSELAEIEDSKAYFSKKIEESKKFSQEIQSDAAAIEKFAREKYHMKRDNEDLFLIVPATNE